MPNETCARAHVQSLLWETGDDTTNTVQLFDPGFLPNPAYGIAAVGDFNRDGHPDIVWRNDTTGATALWLLGAVDTTNDTVAYLGTVNLPALPATIWKMQGTSFVSIIDVFTESDPNLFNAVTGPR